MNTARMLLNLSRRSYVTRKRIKPEINPGLTKRLEMLEEPEHDLESVEHLDLESLESDFMRVDGSYAAHKQEMHDAKEKLKFRIVGRKYFKEDTPNLLTFMEKEQIRYLHSNDPAEWTPEKLSEGFPALPHVIKKVIKAKWLPKSAERVLQHDQFVIENWRKFKRGELPLDEQLRQHLLKFKDRKINLPSLEEVKAKIIPPPPTFAKPKHTLFSDIITTHLDDEENHSLKISDNAISQKSLPSGDQNKSKSIEEKCIDVAKADNSCDTYVIGRSKQGRLVTLDKFVTNTMQHPKKSRSIENRIMIDEYRRKMESTEHLAKAQISDQVDKQSRAVNSTTAENLPWTDSRNTGLKITSEELFDAECQRQNLQQLELRTYVKSWEKKEVDQASYPETIQIPKHKFQPGKSYRVGKCYYDSDGKFLYKILIEED